VPSRCVKGVQALCSWGLLRIVIEMPSGRTHLRIEAVLLFGWTALGGWLLAASAVPVESVIAFVLAYAFSMVLLSPDLDLVRSRAFRRWGKMRWIWAPYALLFRHRRLSHHPLLGPATRIAYLALIAAVVTSAVVLLVGRPLRIAIPPAEIVLGGVLGLYLPNLTHVLADRTVSALRRRRPL